jgi:hypothetical protein
MTETETKEVKSMTDFMADLAMDCQKMAIEIFHFTHDPANEATDSSIWPVIGRLKDYSGLLEHKTKELQNLLNP